MEGFKIKNQCSEKWNEMTPNEKGAFCSKCSKSVNDFSNKSLEEIKRELIKNKGVDVCGRIQANQTELLNKEFNVWQMSSKKTMNRAMLFSLIIVFGLSIVSCSNEQDEKVIQDFQTQVNSIVTQDSEVLSDEIIFSRDSRDLKNLPILSEDMIKDSVVSEVEKDTAIVQTHDISCFLDVEVAPMMMVLLGISVKYQEFLEDTVPPIVNEYDDSGRLLPNVFSALLYPNPTVSEFNIDLNVAERNLISIQLFNQQGEFVQSIKNEEFERGSYAIPVSLSRQSAGVYLIVIQSLGYNKTLRIIKQ